VVFQYAGRAKARPVRKQEIILTPTGLQQRFFLVPWVVPGIWNPKFGISFKPERAAGDTGRPAAFCPQIPTIHFSCPLDCVWDNTLHGKYSEKKDGWSFQDNSDGNGDGACTLLILLTEPETHSRA